MGDSSKQGGETEDYGRRRTTACSNLPPGYWTRRFKQSKVRQEEPANIWALFILNCQGILIQCYPSGKYCLEKAQPELFPCLFENISLMGLDGVDRPPNLK